MVKHRSMPSVDTALQLADVPAHLPTTMLRARNDEQLISAWLSRPGLSPRTVRSSGKEAWRFLAWCRARGHALADVRMEDLADYSAFLLDPQPISVWVQPTKFVRSDPRWRPFAGPLATSSHRQAMVIVRALFTWATAAKYLPGNPGKSLGRLSLPIEESVSRFLSHEGIGFLLAAVGQLPSRTDGQQRRQIRARFLVHLYYLTAARLSEVAGANMSSIRRDHVGSWWLHVLGKGSKAGQIPVPPSLLLEFQAYRSRFGFAGMPAPRDPTPLVLTTTGQMRRATHYAIAKVMTHLMQKASDIALAQGQDETADRLSQASTHWLRHSSLTHQVDAGVPLKTVQMNGRHASMATTGRYVHKDRAIQHAETVAAMTIKSR